MKLFFSMTEKNMKITKVGVTGKSDIIRTV